MNRFFVCAALALTLSSTAFAQGTRDPVVKGREARQGARIRQGERSGALTPAESTQVRGEEKKLHQDEATAKADGNLSPVERAKLRQEARDVSRDIHTEKHNGDAVAPAAVRTPVVNQRQANQAARIRQGVKSGELTPAETAKLHGERVVRETKRAAKADGVVTPAEHAQLNQEQNDVSKDIHAEKHDAQVR